jgi:hypothetical protein
MQYIIPVVLKFRMFGLFLGLPFASAKPSKPPTPKPSCPKGFYVTWADPPYIPVASWLCCKKSDKKGDCKVGQAAFPYGPRHKLVCCQCPTGEVLNHDKNGCVPTGSQIPSSTPIAKPSPPGGVPMASPTTKPTSLPTAESTPSPTSDHTRSPTSEPTRSPTSEPTAKQISPLSASPTLSPSHQNKNTDMPTVSGTTAPPTFPPPPLTCESGYSFTISKDLNEQILNRWFKLRPNFFMCCKEKLPTTLCPIRDVPLLRYKLVPPESCCYCLPQEYVLRLWIFADILSSPIIPGYCA